MAKSRTDRISPEVQAFTQFGGQPGFSGETEAARKVAGCRRVHKFRKFLLEGAFGLAQDPFSGQRIFHPVHRFEFEPFLGDGIRLEHFDRPGKGAKLVAAPRAGHLDVEIVVGKAAYHAGKMLEGPRNPVDRNIDACCGNTETQDHQDAEKDEIEPGLGFGIRRVRLADVTRRMHRFDQRIKQWRGRLHPFAR